VRAKWEQIRDRKLADPASRSRYEQKRDALIAVRRVLLAMDEERERRHLSKTELASIAGLQPAAVRRLLTAEDTNPTLRTVVGVANALGFEVELRPKSGTPNEKLNGQSQEVGQMDAHVPFRVIGDFFVDDPVEVERINRLEAEADRDIAQLQKRKKRP